VQHYRVELPGPKVTKEVPSDARVRLEVQRAEFNKLAEGGTSGWRRAFTVGSAKASGPAEILQLIQRVVDRQDERDRTRRAQQR